MINYIPKDSLLHLWLEGESFSKAPVSFKILSAMFSAGAVVRGNTWVEFRGRQIRPGFSVLFSGEGRNNALSSVLSLVMSVDPPLLAGASTLTATKAVLNPDFNVVLVNRFEQFIGNMDSTLELLEVIQSEKPVVLMAAADGGLRAVNTILENYVLVVHEDESRPVVLPYTEEEFRRVESARWNFLDEMNKITKIKGQMELSVPAEKHLHSMNDGILLTVKMSAVSALLRGDKFINLNDVLFAQKLLEYARQTTSDWRDHGSNQTKN